MKKILCFAMVLLGGSLANAQEEAPWFPVVFTGPLPANTVLLPFVPIGIQQGKVFFTVSLSGANAVPPNSSPFLGTATLTLGDGYLIAPQPGGLRVSNLLEFSIQLPGAAIPSPGLSFYPLWPAFEDSSGSNVFGTGWSPQQWYGAVLQGIGFGGGYRLTPEQVADLLAGRWYLAVKAVEPSGALYPEGDIRGPIVPVDTDDDGVPDYSDRCPDTPAGAVVDVDGCAIEQLVPCSGTWRNHGDYVKAVSRVAVCFLRDGLITEAQRQMIVREAARSNCGK